MLKKKILTFNFERSEEEVDPFIMLQRQTIGNEVIENLIVSYKDFFLVIISFCCFFI